MLPVSLPRIAVPGVSFHDGVQESEVFALAAHYFRWFVSSCGMPDPPQEDRQYWRVQLWGGYAPSDYGTLFLAKDGSEVKLKPPKRGFGTSTALLLKRHMLI